jgi:SHS2 domain-containing protein
VLPGHELENHTADVALRAWGPTVRDVFEQAALAMCGLMYDPAEVEPRDTVRIELDAPDDELLLAAWLNELLYLAEAESFLGCRFRIEEAGSAGVDRATQGVRLRAAVAGERDTAGGHTVRAVVKAATLHELSIRPKDAGWEGHVLLDV